MKKQEATIAITIPFHDVDSAGMVWHGHYAKYFEIARCELLDGFGYGYQEMLASGFSWPVIDMQVRFVQALKFGQRILVRATLREWENRLLIDYLITDEASGQRLTKASTSQVAVDLGTGELCLVSPDVLLERLGIER